VDRARALAPSVREAPVADASATVSLNPELFGRAPSPSGSSLRTVSIPPTSLDPPSRPAPPRRLAVGVVAVVGLVAALAVGIPALTPQAPPAPLRASGAPRVTDDRVAQEQLELAWQSFLQGDRVEALRRLETASAGTPDSPLPELLRSYVLLRDGQVAASLVASSEAARRWPDDPTPAGSLLRAVAAQHRAGAVDVPELRAHLDAQPDDLLALLMAADHCAMVSATACHRDVPALLAAAPRAPLAHHVAAESWQELGDAVRSRAAIDAGLDLSPDDPGLLELRAQDELQRADHDAARATLDRVQRVDPHAQGPKLLRVRLAVLEGDVAGLDALRVELTSPSQPSATRLGFWEAAADTLVGLGQTRAAEALYLEALTATEGRPADRFLVHLGARQVATARGDLDAALTHLDAAAAVAAANPEVPRDLRDRLTGHLLRTLGQRALVSGDRAYAEAQLQRLRAAPGISPDTVETLARELAVAAGDVQGVLGLGVTLWDGECERGAVFGDAVLRAGDPNRARPLLEAALAGGCVTYTRQRALSVLARVALAEVHLAAGELTAASAQLDLAQLDWTAPDADHALVRRLQVARARVSGSGVADDR
jgi:tetratricopeptide (TPR) repeat protein